MLEYKLRRIPDMMISIIVIPPLYVPLILGYFWVFLLLYSIVMFVFYLFSRKKSLVINHTGIINYINGQYASWDFIGDYKDNVHFNDHLHKSGVYGIAIIHKDEVNNPEISSEYNKKNYVMFIDKNRIAASDYEIKEILDLCIGHYVKGIDISRYQIKVKKTFSIDALKLLILFLVYLFGSKYVYDNIIYNESNIILYVIWFFITNYLALAFPYIIYTHEYKFSTFVYIIGILYVLFLYYVIS